MNTLSVRDLASHALVIFVDGGHAASNVMDEMEETDHKDAEVEVEFDNAVDLPDTMAVPEGMNLREASMGVIPSA